MAIRSGRTTRDVLESHFELLRRHDLESDLLHNYSPEVVVVSTEGINHGHHAVRMAAKILDGSVPKQGCDYGLVVDGEYALLTWSARDGDATAHDGANSYLVRDGLIQMQSVYFSVRPST